MRIFLTPQGEFKNPRLGVITLMKAFFCLQRSPSFFFFFLSGRGKCQQGLGCLCERHSALCWRPLGPPPCSAQSVALEMVLRTPFAFSTPQWLSPSPSFEDAFSLLRPVLWLEPRLLETKPAPSQPPLPVLSDYEVTLLPFRSVCSLPEVDTGLRRAEA